MAKTERLRIDGVDAFSVSAFFVAIESRGYERKKFTPTSIISHLEIYQYASGADKFTFVYDTVAKILTVAGSPDALERLKPLLPFQKLPAKPPAPKQTQNTTANRPKERVKEQQQSGKEQTKVGKAQTKTVKEQPQGGKAQTKSGQNTAKRQKTEKTESHQKANIGQKKENRPSKGKPQEKTITIKNVGAKRLEWVIKDLGESGVKVRTTRQEKVVDYSLTRGKDVLEVRREEGGAITLKGGGSGLLTDVKTQLESKSNLKLLKKYVPTALRYLSESSKIDLSNGISDLSNIGRLSDYSVMLMTPCRALEKFIYDLEHAQNINVKMIGQAYEKDDSGKYSLKKGYLKRIRSVIYPEVMAALYTEYFATRNFYLHSDNSADSKPRGISDKAEAQRILDRLLSVIEYNSIKLGEIGFTVEGEQ